MAAKKKKRGFTDRMYLYNVIFVTVMVLLSFIAVFLSGKLEITDTSVLSAIVTSAYAELAIHTGFIIWKAKAENCRKHKDLNAMNNEGGDVG